MSAPSRNRLTRRERNEARLRGGQPRQRAVPHAAGPAIDRADRAGRQSVTTKMRYARADVDTKRAALSQVFPETLGPPAGGSAVVDGADMAGWLRAL
ncbi:MAG: hypothetical protein OXG82_00155 [Gammaproteobacteria bacterium]|nr:hypothetical protein [Gammaproteobacteria bacterium]